MYINIDEIINILKVEKIYENSDEIYYSKTIIKESSKIEYELIIYKELSVEFNNSNKYRYSIIVTPHGKRFSSNVRQYYTTLDTLIDNLMKDSHFKKCLRCEKIDKICQSN